MNPETSAEGSNEAQRAELEANVARLAEITENVKRIAMMSRSGMTPGSYFDAAGTIVADAEQRISRRERGDQQLRRCRRERSQEHGAVVH